MTRAFSAGFGVVTYGGPMRYPTALTQRVARFDPIRARTLLKSVAYRNTIAAPTWYYGPRFRQSWPRLPVDA